MSKMLAATTTTTSPDQAINELWWITMIESVVALFFGISAVFWPELTLLTLVYLLAAFVLGIGILQLLFGIMSIRARGSWWATMLIGFLGIGLGIYLVRHPHVTLHTLTLLIGLLLITRGLLDLVRALTDRASVRSGNTSRILLTIIGIAALIAGIFIMTQPVSGGIAFVWILGVYAITFGVLNMAIAIELKSALHEQSYDNTADMLASEAGRNKADQLSGSRATRSSKT
jgi:uncharacterized membrane protein HdeD (DUF308 family)